MRTGEIRCRFMPEHGGAECAIGYSAHIPERVVILLLHGMQKEKPYRHVFVRCGDVTMNVPLVHLVLPDVPP